MTPKQRDLVETVRRHGALLVQHDPEGTTFSLPNGRAVHAGVAKRAVEAGHLVPNEDGLLAGITQSYRAAS